MFCVITSCSNHLVPEGLQYVSVELQALAIGTLARAEAAAIPIDLGQDATAMV